MLERSITKIFKFDSAHYLPSHDGKCANLHGHTYELHITVCGKLSEHGPEKGMIMDFGHLKNVVNNEIISKLDHKNLNELFENPTAEVMCDWIYCQLNSSFGLNDSSPFGLNFYLKKIRLYETPTSYCEIEFKPC